MRGPTSTFSRYNDNLAPDHIPHDFPKVFQLQLGIAQVARQEFPPISVLQNYQRVENVPV